MKLYEYEAKSILSKYGIAVPNGGHATSAVQAQEIAARLRLPVAVKAQVLVAGRGKAGGILFAESADEVGRIAEKILNMRIKGLPVKSVWVEEKIHVNRELYFGITTDRFNRCYVAVGFASRRCRHRRCCHRKPLRKL